MSGLSKLDVLTIFKRHFKDMALSDSLINSIAMAVGEAIEENNKKLFENLKATNSIKQVGKL